MKLIIKILLFNCLMFLSVNTYSQDKEPQAMKFVWGSSSIERELQVDSFKQDNFLTGFQWHGSAKMNKALENNAAASDTVFSYNVTAYTSKLYSIAQPRYIRTRPGLNGGLYITGYQVGIWNAPAMVYEPTLRIPKNDSTGMLIVRKHDPTNAVFGFHYIRGQILPENQYSDENYNRLTLRKGVDTGLVLNDLWPKPRFETFDGTGQKTDYRGQKWYFTINLRRKNINDDDTLDNAIVLEIKLPYRTTEPTYRSIRFDSLPSRSFFTHRM
jgi:hypothetical protein